MATLLLAAAGNAVGGLFGATAGIVGQAVGSLAGGLVDQALFGGGAGRSVGKLSDLDVQSSSEGAVIPRVYGRMRLAGEVIWATRFEEASTSESAGGKGGGPAVTTYSYFANFAVALCEGPVAQIGRVWANGDLLDLNDVMIRVHLGGEEQEPDALVLAKQGSAPAYRGVAYVVFERLPLDDFGNALPQLTFEVIRPTGRLEGMMRGVTLIPGATEFGYATSEVTSEPAKGVTWAENRHAATATSDVAAALDELQAVCPRLESVAVVAAWFGDDLRAGSCTVRPKVDQPVKTTRGMEWSVAGATRGAAALTSRVDGKPAFGGTPSDASVLELIASLKARGLAVTFYPFVMMDIPQGNALPNPEGGTAQPAYPWRGRITCHPGRGAVGSPYGTAAAAAQVANFVGTAQRNQFAVAGGAVSYSGPAEWSYRRMILHYAHLCKAAGGVETFLIGSELRGLTSIRGQGRAYPFVAALKTLAADVKAVLGAATKVSYAADWSEWFGDQPAAGDVAFHLDALWSDANIDFVGVDAYLPLADWRDGDHADAEVANGPTDRAYLAGNVAGGEGFDWYYASEADRRAGTRTAITDGAAGKPWVYRYKDFASWWANRHYDRVGGVEQASPSGWLAGMKPIRFTEIGCPAVDGGANQPNVFVDAQSSESAAPYFSRGTRDDAMQRRAIEAILTRFDPAAPGFVAAHNPVSPVDGRRMVDHARSHVWTWDARPFPWFPLASDVWSDGANWATGHWLNGRLGAAPLDDTIAAVLSGVVVGTLDVEGLSPVVDGVAITDRSSPRDLIEALARLYRFTVVETATGLRFADRPRRVGLTISRDDLTDDGDAAVVEMKRAQAEDVPGEVAVSFLNTEADGRQSSAVARRDGPPRVLDLALPVAGSATVMQGEVEALIKDLDAGRETVRFALPPAMLAPEPGDVVDLDLDGAAVRVLIRSIEDGDVRRVEARTVDVSIVARAASVGVKRTGTGFAAVSAAPVVAVLDLPALDGDDAPYRPYLAAAAEPWPRQMAVHRKVAGGYQLIDTLSAPAVMGELDTPLGAGRVWQVDDRNTVEVTLVRGTLASLAMDAVLDGGNLAAIGSEAGWEVVQFAGAELIGERRYRLSQFLRGQGGTEALAAAGHPAGAMFVLLDGAVRPLPIARTQVGRALTLRVGPARRNVGDSAMTELTVTPAGVGLTPLAPVRLRAERDAASGAVTLRWTRRTRIAGDDFAAVEVPLDEASEVYELRIHDGTAVRRAVTVTAPEAVYSAVEQVADFGALPARLDVSVRQMSATLGAGREVRRTIDV